MRRVWHPSTAAPVTTPRLPARPQVVQICASLMDPDEFVAALMFRHGAADADGTLAGEHAHSLVRDGGDGRGQVVVRDRSGGGGRCGEGRDRWGMGGDGEGRRRWGTEGG